MGINIYIVKKNHATFLLYWQVHLSSKYPNIRLKTTNICQLIKVGRIFKQICRILKNNLPRASQNFSNSLTIRIQALVNFMIGWVREEIIIIDNLYIFIDDPILSSTTLWVVDKNMGVYEVVKVNMGVVNDNMGSSMKI